MKKKNYTIKEEKYYPFDHDKVNKHFEGGLTFVAEFCVNGEYQPVAVFKVANPNRKKGHKDYLLLQYFGDTGGYVRGMDSKEIKKYLKQHAVMCPDCNVVLYSINRHHFHSCGCENESFVDGGRDYLRSGGKKLPITGLLDFTKKTFKPSK